MVKNNEFSPLGLPAAVGLKCGWRVAGVWLACGWRAYGVSEPLLSRIVASDPPDVASEAHFE